MLTNPARFGHRALFTMPEDLGAREMERSGGENSFLKAPSLLIERTFLQCFFETVEER